ncbi:hypothetical protein MA16_Dca015537 [Dendrobium catenatum]|uniref:Uncharacterized protein n=1 Tax=Dendrobium catenatum TaxID=906689 RepID=A0A2I0WHQ6_9ASPA|nr:hypothetical protein MA16_Dca015537 [Dendrobium catenatum]
MVGTLVLAHKDFQQQSKQQPGRRDNSWLSWSGLGHHEWPLGNQDSKIGKNLNFEIQISNLKLAEGGIGRVGKVAGKVAGRGRGSGRRRASKGRPQLELGRDFLVVEEKDDGGEYEGEDRKPNHEPRTLPTTGGPCDLLSLSSLPSQALMQEEVEK